jgi:hypothetical protein
MRKPTEPSSPAAAGLDCENAAPPRRRQFGGARTGAAVAVRHDPPRLHRRHGRPRRRPVRQRGTGSRGPKARLYRQPQMYLFAKMTGVILQVPRTPGPAVVQSSRLDQVPGARTAAWWSAGAHGRAMNTFGRLVDPHRQAATTRPVTVGAGSRTGRPRNRNQEDLRRAKAGR